MIDHDEELPFGGVILAVHHCVTETTGEAEAVEYARKFETMYGTRTVTEIIQIIRLFFLYGNA